MSNVIPIMSNLDILRSAAENGDIELLYTVLKNKPSILEDIDSEKLIETPLHIAASKGHIPFAIEIMNWKPSFALKLNPEGLSPIHLAVAEKNKRMLLRFTYMNKDLVRVKGKGGWTPLHLASQIGDVDILAELLHACPDSIEDVTVWGETAMHIAAKNNNYDALHLLVRFLNKNIRINALVLQKNIVNWKDKDDNTILHISVQNNHPKKTILLVMGISRYNLNAKNLEDKTALDMAISEEIKKTLSRSGAKPGSQVINSRTRAEKIKSRITFIGSWSIGLRRLVSQSDEIRTTLLVIFTLIVTATYQSVLSPPGGFHQADASDNNANIISSNTTTTTMLRSAGKSVMSKSVFFGFSYLNMISFSMSMLIILIMSPGIANSPVPLLSWTSFAISYLYSMWTISPTHSNDVGVLIFSFTVAFFMFIFIIISQYFRFQWIRNFRKPDSS